MKLRKILALALTFIISIQSISINSFADSYFETNENVIEEDIHKNEIFYDEDNIIFADNGIQYVKLDDNNYMMFSEEYPDGEIIPAKLVNIEIKIAGVWLTIGCLVLDGVIEGIFEKDIKGFSASVTRRIKDYVIGKYVEDVNRTEVPNYNCHPAWGSTCRD